MLRRTKTFPNMVHTVTETMITRLVVRNVVDWIQRSTYPLELDKSDDVVLFISD